MKALFWKEWRENFKWALMGAVAITGAMFYGLRSDPEQMNYGNELWQSLCSPQFLLVTTFGFPLIALALGFLQILTELRRDQWAFLIHRPVTRGQIFLGKIIPGLLLYLLATTVPLVLVAWWASLPGSIPAPFDWRLTQAGWVDCLTGIGFYFAAIWVGIQPGRWYGRRILPLMAASYGAVLSKGYLPLIPALEIAILTLVAVIPATWAMFNSAGRFDRGKLVGKLATLLSLLLAIAILQTWLMAGWQLVFPPKPYTGTNFVVDKQGTLVKVTQQGSSFKSVTTLDGQKLEPEGKSSFQWDDFLNSFYLSLSNREQPYSPSYRRADRFFSILYNTNNNEQYWYILIDRAQLVAYNRLSNALQGYLGPNGYFPGDERDQAGEFDVGPNLFRFQNLNELILARETLYRLELNRPAVQSLYQVPADQTLFGAAEIYGRTSLPDEKRDFVISTDKFVQMHAADGSIRWSFPQPADLDHFDSVSVSQLPDKSKVFLLYQTHYKWTTRQSPLFYTLSADGSVLDRIELPKGKESPIQKLRWNAVKDAILTPFGQTLWQQVNYAVHSVCEGKEYRPIWKTRTDFRNYTLAVWGISLATGVVCTLLGLPLFRRLELSRKGRIAWIAFLLLFSIGGLLVFLLVNDWPPRRPCPACGRKRSLERLTCESCGTRWPEPVKDGTEIFEVPAPSAENRL